MDSAYDAMHMGCLAVLMTEAYRVTSAAGHHKELLEAVCNRIGGSTGVWDRVEATMDARNAKYGGALRTVADAADAMKIMDEFLALVEKWLTPRLGKLKPG